MMHERIAVSFGERSKREPYRAALRGVEIDFVENPATLEGLIGLMLTGGTDVDPALYGKDRQPETDEPDTERDHCEISLLNNALERDIPVLAICRGMQLFNVCLGGTLTQHINGHRRRGELDAHAIQIRTGTKLATVLNRSEYCVNSRHHQSVAAIGPDLVIAATAQDGIVEALEFPGKRFALGVQWHPEDRVDGPDRRLFEAFRDALLK
jgi:putative glutamine amidotransferase